MNVLPNYPIHIGHLPSPSQAIELPTDQALLDLIAKECGVTTVNNLKTKFRIKRYRKHGLTIFGDFTAEIGQECISTLEPMTSRISENFERRFLPQNDSDYKMPEIIDGEMVLDPEADDIPDLIEGNEVNLWEVLIEEMNLVIDPFPRLNDLPEVITDIDENPEQDAEEPTHRPFSDLKALISEKKTNK